MIKVMKKMIIGIAILIVLAVLFILIGRSIHGAQTKVKSEEGISETVLIQINDIEQQVSIQGKNKDNPIILFLHGGPGNPMGFLNYVWQPYLYEQYTVVSYNQRGCGRTYYRNPSAEVSKELILQDIDATVDYLRERFNRENIIILGHSWGTVVGTQYVYKYPEKVSCYIGVGQIIKLDEETETAQKPKGDKEKELYQIYLEALLSPDMSLQDMKWFLGDRSKTTVNEPLKSELKNFDANAITEYKVPMYFISGSNDFGASVEAVKVYYEKIVAPEKNMIIVDGAGHATFLDLPKEFAAAVRDVIQ